LLFRVVALFVRPGVFDTFEPDVFLEDQQSLTSYGLEATVLHLPGHTKVSIGILTVEKNLFYGDLLDSMGRPSLEFFIDDMVAARGGLTRVRSMEQSGSTWARQTVSAQPGHREPMTAVPANPTPDDKNWCLTPPPLRWFRPGTDDAA
jgi:glyoxylase-like metal-dependent hydrolase (beta-lactamase superfamily II)